MGWLGRGLVAGAFCAGAVAMSSAAEAAPRQYRGVVNGAPVSLDLDNQNGAVRGRVSVDGRTWTNLQGRSYGDICIVAANGLNIEGRCHDAGFEGRAFGLVGSTLLSGELRLATPAAGGASAAVAPSTRVCQPASGLTLPGGEDRALAQAASARQQAASGASSLSSVLQRRFNAYAALPLTPQELQQMQYYDQESGRLAMRGSLQAAMARANQRNQMQQRFMETSRRQQARATLQATEQDFARIAVLSDNGSAEAYNEALLNYDGALAAAIQQVPADRAGLPAFAALDNAAANLATCGGLNEASGAAAAKAAALAPLYAQAVNEALGQARTGADLDRRTGAFAAGPSLARQPAAEAANAALRGRRQALAAAEKAQAEKDAAEASALASAQRRAQLAQAEAAARKAEADAARESGRPAQRGVVTASGEPTAAQLEAAVASRLGLVAGRMNMGQAVKLTYFKKIACDRAQGRAGWNCDFQYQNPMNAVATQLSVGLMAAITGGNGDTSDLVTAGSGRFVNSEGTWMMMQNE